VAGWLGGRAAGWCPRSRLARTAGGLVRTAPARGTGADSRACDGCAACCLLRRLNVPNSPNRTLRGCQHHRAIGRGGRAAGVPGPGPGPGGADSRACDGCAAWRLL